MVVGGSRQETLNPGFVLLCTRQHYQQQSTMGMNKPNPRGGRNQEKVLEVNKAHIEESIQLCHKSSLHLESSKQKEKKKIKEQVTPRIGDRHKKN
ncbi:unnamed protein product [Schistosoma margrebowiei]|uniref:Uncharacterized protein n=1 Tax=Schistosoma margrebowiei TaxID=48269 RepID=A0A183LYP1_9TREM|nr:unnamed protein product [Schistosoma margrebowiei]